MNSLLCVSLKCAQGLVCTNLASITISTRSRMKRGGARETRRSDAAAKTEARNDRSRRKRAATSKRHTRARAIGPRAWFSTPKPPPTRKTHAGVVALHRDGATGKGWGGGAEKTKRCFLFVAATTASTTPDDGRRRRQNLNRGALAPSNRNCGFNPYSSISC